MTGPLIGVLGAGGAVGRAAAAALTERLRLGGRRAEPLHETAALCSGEAQVWPVDAGDPDRLAEFCAGCQVVLNCAGPSYRIGDRAARAALAAGADYVDVSGDDPVRDRLRDRAEQAIVLSAGLQPGVTGLLPRWAAGGFTAVARMTAYVGGLEPVTPAGAADYLISLDSGYGTALGAWRDGRRVNQVLRPLTDVELAHFPGRVHAHPFLSTEGARSAAALGLIELDWYNVIAGDHLRIALTRLRERPWAAATDSELAAATEQLVAAATVDLAGRRPYQTMVLRLHGHREGEPRTRTVVLHAADSYRVTGVTGALAVRAVLDRLVPSGVHFAADVLDPTWVLAGLETAGAARVRDETEAAVIEGAL